MIRSHGVLRLIKLMIQISINTIEEGNRFLKKYIKSHNALFAKDPESDINAHRPLVIDMDLKNILCRKEERKISKSLEIYYKGKIYQLKGQSHRLRLEGMTALVIQGADGIRIQCKGKTLEYSIFDQDPGEVKVMYLKYLNAFLNRKKRLSIIEQKRRGSGKMYLNLSFPEKRRYKKR